MQQQQQQGLNGDERRTVLCCTQCGFGQVLYINLPRSLACSLQCYVFCTKDMTTIHGGGQVQLAEIALSLSRLFHVVGIAL